MSQLTLEISDDMTKRYDEIADKLNVSRSKNGQDPITGVAVMQIVLARFAGLPVADDVDADTLIVSAQGGKAPTTQNEFTTTPPHGG